MTSGVLVQLPATRRKRRYESSLCVAAATLKRARAGEIRATRVIGTVESEDDVEGLRDLVDQVADEFEVDGKLKLNGAGFSVRFSLRD